MSDDLFQVPATISGVRTLVDGGSKVTVDTQAMGPDDLAKLFSLSNKFGYFLFKETEFTAEDIPDDELKGEGKNAKTPSERLRAHMFIYWRDCTRQNEPFKHWYERAMERDIKRWQDKLPER